MALRELNIRNFAIIKHLELDVDDGLTVITGETGAGKSIVLGALNLLLGSRAESDMIRHTEDQCEVSALFSIEQQTGVKQWLELRDLSDENAPNYCLVRRVVRTNKPTKCYINDQPTTLASLRELGLMLVDLHGQHEHQSLLRLTHQRHTSTTHYRSVCGPSRFTAKHGYHRSQDQPHEERVIAYFTKSK